ncbi:MAG: HDOD domain-containing protein [Mariprofundaceae bacterium]|nr:HDOD domain-containing protein [Mariprofundaceae bacterium]
MNDDLQNKLMGMVDKMPPFPKSVHRIIDLSADINCAAKDLVQVIEHDPVITMKLLKLVNSAFFALSRSIASVRHALVYLGLNTVKNLALSIATVDSLPRKKVVCFNTHEFLLHSLTTASIAQKIAKKFDVESDATDVFVAALLHDFGKAVLAQFETELFTQAVTEAAANQESLHLAELRVIGADHAQVGGMLAKKWDLPKELVDCIQQHHQGVSSPLGDCVFAANQISKQAEFGRSGNTIVEEFPDYIIQRFGGSMQEMLDQLGDLSGEKEKASAFINM